MSQTIIAIDPGKKNLAWAKFYDSEFERAGLSRLQNHPPNLGAIADMHCYALPQADLIILEEMFLPADGKGWKAKQAIANDLLTLQAIGGIVAGRMGKRVITVRPAEWKGQVTKKITRYRVDGTDLETGKRIGEGALSFVERARLYSCLAPIPISLQHNLIDAVAIGLTFLNRMHHKPFYQGTKPW